MVKVDAEACIGCGACVALAPEMFEMGPDGKARAKAGAVGDPKEVSEACPVGAIKV